MLLREALLLFTVPCRSQTISQNGELALDEASGFLKRCLYV
jgi:hypothetical protein